VTVRLGLLTQTLPATARMMAREVRFVTDSPLEGAGFEPSVPLYRSGRAVTPVFVFVRDHHWPCDYGFPADIVACGISVRLGT
jgi:hypothetical protein